MTSTHETWTEPTTGGRVKAWIHGVQLEAAARQQLTNVASLPIVHGWVAAMHDAHWGIGATVGSVIPTRGAIIPAAVGVDIGCGMRATRTSLVASDLPDDLRGVRSAIEAAVPHGRAALRTRRDPGAWGEPPFHTDEHAVNCHHIDVTQEHHLGADVWVSRKGAVRAGLGELGIIPGSMGAKSFIVRGKGNAESFCSCGHGAGRSMSRAEARRRFTVEEHARATARVECRKDEGVIDETPAAYKDIDAVMAAQADLVEVVHTLRQVVCVKG
jgi:RNA-splicing ligase RtcB